jgi:zinc protease
LGQSPTLPEGLEKVTSVEGITEYVLDNGLRALLFPDPSQQTITVNVTYLVGSKHENYGETGMAHLLEHLVFKGSSKHPDIDKELTEYGENLEWALDLESDRMINSFIAQKDLDSEMTVVRNEFEMGENYPQSVLMERVFATAYLWHNYGKSTIGARSDIENVPIDRLQAFYRKWYQPDNAILVVAGNFDEAKVLELIEEKFGSIPRPERELQRLYTVEPPQDGERSVTLHRVGDVQMVAAAYHIPAGTHPDFAALDLTAFILGDTPSGRLHKALVETKKAATIGEFAEQLAEPGMLMFFAEVRKEKSLDDARATLLDEIELLAETPPTAEEVERARTSRLASWETTMRDSERSAIRLSEWAALGDWRMLFLQRDRIGEVTPEDVQRVAATYLIPINRTLGLYIPTEDPTRAAIPEAPDAAALVKDYKGGESLAGGEALDVSPLAIEAQIKRDELPSGLHMVTLPKDTRGDIVQLSLSLHFGDLESLRGRARIGEMTAAILMRGTASKSRQEIQDELDRLKAQLRVFGGASGARARLEVPRDGLPAALRLLTEVLREPSFPASELELLKEEEMARLEDSMRDPFQIAFTAFDRHLNDWPEDDPRYVETPEESITRTQQTSLEEIRQFHAELYGASAAELSVVGDFDPEELEAQVAELLGNWQSPKPYERLGSPYRETAPLVREFETPDKESAAFVAGHPIALRDDDPDYPALVLGNFMTGGGFLSSRLGNRIRNQDGLSYGVGSFFSASAWEKDAGFTAYAICAPQNAARVEAAFKEEIAKILESGFTEEEIKTAKKGWLEGRQISRAKERELAGRLAGLEHRGRTLEWEADLEARVQALTAEEILLAMRRHIDLEKMSIITAGDFANAQKEEPTSP